MEIEIVCPKAKKPVKGIIIKGGTIEKEEWKAQDPGLSDQELISWKTIVVKCSFCGNNHEYVLTINPA